MKECSRWCHRCYERNKKMYIMYWIIIVLMFSTSLWLKKKSTISIFFLHIKIPPILKKDIHLQVYFISLKKNFTVNLTDYFSWRSNYLLKMLPKVWKQYHIFLLLRDQNQSEHSQAKLVIKKAVNNSLKYLQSNMIDCLQNSMLSSLCLFQK